MCRIYLQRQLRSYNSLLRCDVSSLHICLILFLVYHTNLFNSRLDNDTIVVTAGSSRLNIAGTDYLYGVQQVVINTKGDIALIQVIFQSFSELVTIVHLLKLFTSIIIRLQEASCSMKMSTSFVSTKPTTMNLRATL